MSKSSKGSASESAHSFPGQDVVHPTAYVPDADKCCSFCGRSQTTPQPFANRVHICGFLEWARNGVGTQCKSCNSYQNSSSHTGKRGGPLKVEFKKKPETHEQYKAKLAEWETVRASGGRQVPSSTQVAYAETRGGTQDRQFQGMFWSVALLKDEAKDKGTTLDVAALKMHNVMGKSQKGEIRERTSNDPIGVAEKWGFVETVVGKKQKLMDASEQMYEGQIDDVVAGVIASAPTATVSKDGTIDINYGDKTSPQKAEAIGAADISWAQGLVFADGGDEPPASQSSQSSQSKTPGSSVKKKKKKAKLVKVKKGAGTGVAIRTTIVKVKKGAGTKTGTRGDAAGINPVKTQSILDEASRAKMRCEQFFRNIADTSVVMGVTSKTAESLEKAIDGALADTKIVNLASTAAGLDLMGELNKKKRN